MGSRRPPCPATADDLMATLAPRVNRDAVVIVSSDKDASLVDDDIRNGTRPRA